MFDFPLPIHSTTRPSGHRPHCPHGAADPNRPFVLTVPNPLPAVQMSGLATPMVLARFATLSEAMQGAIDHAEGIAPVFVRSDCPACAKEWVIVSTIDSGHLEVGDGGEEGAEEAGLVG